MSTNPSLQQLSDLDLLVEFEHRRLDAWGYGSYRYEHQEQAQRFRAALKEAEDEAVRRGLMEPTHCRLTPTGEAVDHRADPRVAAKEQDNASYFAARFGGRGHHRSPYGEEY